MKLITICFLFLATNLVFPSNAFATPVPVFSACANPTGTVISSYSSGKFGIAGKEGEFSGSDTVYRVSDDAVTQCFCPSDGKGIQTNWWKVSQLTTSEVNDLVAKGWILIPDGSVWGLSQDPYLAMNLEYSCGGGGTGGSNNSSNNNGTNNSVTNGAVLGLAATGNIQLSIFLAIVGLVLLSGGLLISKK